MEHINLIFASPGHSMMSSYVKSFLETIKELSSLGISWAWSSEYSSHVADAREITLNGDKGNEIENTKPFKGTVSYDKIMWIDSDISWKPEDVLKLYYSDKDIISGAYLLSSGEVTAYPKMLNPGFSINDILKLDGLTKIEGCGFGFLCVKNGVFESMSRPWFQSVPITVFDEETGKKFTFPIMGEDMSWCQRVRNNGYEIWLDPEVRVTHNKMVQLTWEGMRPWL